MIFGKLGMLVWKHGVVSTNVNNAYRAIGVSSGTAEQEGKHGILQVE